MMRALIVAGLVLSAIASAGAQTILRVGDQKGNSQAVMEAAGVLKDLPYKIEWKEFPAAAPLLEALGAGAIETGLVGDAPFTFAAAANVPVKAIAAIRQSRDGLAVLVHKELPIRDFEGLRERRSRPAAVRSAISSFWPRSNRRDGRPATSRSCSWRRRTPRWRTRKARSTRGRHGSLTSARKKSCSSRGA